MMEIVNLGLSILGAITGLFLAVAGISLTWHHFAVTRANTFMERFSNPHYVEIRTKVDECLAKQKTLNQQQKIEEFLKICTEKPHFFNEIHALCMLFGEIGVSFENKIIGCPQLSIFDRIIPYYWDNLYPFVVACHHHFGFKFNPSAPIKPQIYLFSKFYHASVQMEQYGLSKRSEEQITLRDQWMPFSKEAQIRLAPKFSLHQWMISLIKQIWRF